MGTESETTINVLAHYPAQTKFQVRFRASSGHGLKSVALASVVVAVVEAAKQQRQLLLDRFFQFEMIGLTLEAAYLE